VCFSVYSVSVSMYASEYTSVHVSEYTTAYASDSPSVYALQRRSQRRPQ
jgi:hypothetical protein